MRILQVITELTPAGAEGVVYDLSTGLASQGHDVRVANLFDRPDRPDPDVGDRLNASGVPVTRLAMRSKADVRVFSRLARLVRTFRPHVVHSHLWHADLAVRLLRAVTISPRFASISTVHIADRRAIGWRFAVDRLLHNMSDKITFVSQSVLDFYAPRVGARPDRCVVIPNGIDLDRFAGIARQNPQHDLPATIGTVARLDPQKDLPSLFHAAKILLQKGFDIRVVVAGDGPQFKLLQALAGSLDIADRLDMRGFVEDIPGFLAEVDVFVLPSRWEGFGLATLEAMAAGRPVVVTDVPGSRDLIADGDTGLVVRPANPVELAGAIGRLLADPLLASRLAGAARSAAQRYGVQAMVVAYRQLYETVLARSN